jgi:hypothetical protein
MLGILVPIDQDPGLGRGFFSRSLDAPVAAVMQG